MSIRKWAGACALATLAAGSVAAQTAAGGTVRITSAFPAGSGPDVVARLVADKLSAQWRQPVVVDPRPGGAGVVAINAMKNAPPTGNDLVVVDVGHLSINPLVLRKLAYDPQSELTPVALLYKTAFFVVVGAQSPFHSLAELTAAARRKPGMTYGSNAVGGPLHLGAARAATAMGVEMMHVPYKETSQLYASVSTGEVDWAYRQHCDVRPPAAGWQAALSCRGGQPAFPGAARCADRAGGRWPGRHRCADLGCAHGAQGHAAGRRRAHQRGGEPGPVRA